MQPLADSDYCLARHLEGRGRAQNPHDVGRCMVPLEALVATRDQASQIAQQNSIPVIAIKPRANERGIGLINSQALLRVLQRADTAFITAFELQSPVHRFPAWAHDAAGAQMGCIAAQNLDAVPPFQKAPDEISHGAAIAAQLLGGIKVADNQ